MLEDSPVELETGASLDDISKVLFVCEDDNKTKGVGANFSNEVDMTAIGSQQVLSDSSFERRLYGASMEC